MLTFAKLANKPMVFQQLTGLSLAAFGDILPTFVRAMERLEQQADAGRSQPRKRQRGSGRKPIVVHPADRLIFCLVYFKIYPFQTVQGYEPPNVRTYQPKKRPPKGELTAAEKRLIRRS